MSDQMDTILEDTEQELSQPASKASDDDLTEDPSMQWDLSKKWSLFAEIENLGESSQQVEDSDFESDWESLPTVEEEDEEDDTTGSKQSGRYNMNTSAKLDLAKEELSHSQITTTYVEYEARVESRRKQKDLDRLHNRTNVNNLTPGSISGVTDGSKKRSDRYFAPVFAQGRTPNAYMIFANEQREKMFDESSGVIPKDASMMLARRWAAMTEKEQEKYYTEATWLAEAHEEE